MTFPVQFVKIFMMGNIFDLSAQMPKKKPPGASAHLKKESGSVEEDLLPKLREIKERQNRLVDQVVEAERKLGVDRSDVQNAVEGLKKISPSNWQKHEDKKEELEKMILGEKDALRKKLTSSEKSRKGKVIGARKRWLDMR